jgi:hypothetical protein
VRIEFYAVLAGDELTGDVRVPLDRLTYEETIETDIFGTKNATDGDRATSTPTPTPEGGEPTPTPTDDLNPVSTPTETELL